MQKFVKGVLTGVGAVAALFLIAVLAVNLYVQSAATQRRIERALGSGLHVPVKVTSTIVTPWGGLKASGITVPQVENVPGNFLDASNFRVSFAFWPLFQHRLVVSQIMVQEPKVVWFQGADGRWRLPSELTAQAQPPAVAAPSPRPQPVQPAAKPWQILVHRFAATDASFDFFSERGVQLLEISGVNFDCLDPKTAGTDGHASAANITLRDQLFLRDMRTNWRFEKGLLQLSSFQTAIAGGEFRGNAQVAAWSKHSPFVVDATFDRLDVNQLMTGAGQPGNEINGFLKGSVDLYGNSGKTSSINGSAHLELTGGHMQNLELFQMLGQGLQIPDLVQLNLTKAEADMRTVGGVTQVDRLVLLSQNLRLDAHGTIGDNGRLALQARLTIDAEIASRLPGFIVKYFKEGETEGAKYVDFNVNNTVSHPKTDLIENILGHQIKSQMTGLLQSLFGKKQKELPAASPPPSSVP